MCCDPDSVSSNAVAYHNGKMIEEIVQKIYPDIEFLDKQFDAIYKGIDLEIKSCQSIVTDSSNSRERRSGRFVFEWKQYAALQKRGGNFLFIVHEKGEIKVMFLIPASKVVLPEFIGVRSWTWKTIARQFMGEA